MTDPQPPRLVLCLGVNCNRDRRAEALYRQLEAVLDAADPLHPPFKLRTATCLDRCDHGPNLILYPGGIVVTGLDADRLARVLDEHVFAAPKDDPA